MELIVLGIRIRLYPEPPPKQSIKIRELKKLRKRLLKKDQRKADSQKKSKNKNKKKTFSDILSLIKELSAIVLGITGKMARYLKVNVKKLDVVVASADPAKTALLYVPVCQGLNLIIAKIESSGCKYKFGDMECRCDYLSDKFSCSVDIEFRIRVWQILNMLLYSLMKYFRTQLKNGGRKNG